MGCQGWHWHGSKLPGSLLFFTFLGGLCGSQRQGGSHVPGVGLPQQTPACGHHDAHPSSGTVWIPLRTPFCTAGKHVALRGRVSRPPALQGNNKPQTPKSSATTAKPWGYRGEGEANKPPPFRPTCPTTLPRPCTARSIAPRHGCAPAGAGLCRRRGDAAAGTVPLGGPWLHLPGAPRPAVRHSGLEPPRSRVPPRIAAVPHATEVLLTTAALIILQH